MIDESAATTELMAGFPPPPKSRVTLANWQDPPFNRAGVRPRQGQRDPTDQVTEYVPEASSSGYAGATVRDLLDMRTGVAFRETYTALDAEVRVMEGSMGRRSAETAAP